MELFSGWCSGFGTGSVGIPRLGLGAARQRGGFLLALVLDVAEKSRHDAQAVPPVRTTGAEPRWQVVALDHGVRLRAPDVEVVLDVLDGPRPFLACEREPVARCHLSLDGRARLGSRHPGKRRLQKPPQARPRA
jgi:hypothetical protein